MSSEITTNLQNYIIVFFDGSVKFITQKEYEAIMTQSTNNFLKEIILTDKCKYTFSNMSKVLSLSEYYSQYPDRIPHMPPNQHNHQEKLIDLISVEGMPSLLRGLKQAIDENEYGPETKAYKIYQTYLKKYSKNLSTV